MTGKKKKTIHAVSKGFESGDTTDTSRRGAARREMLRKMAGGGGAAMVAASFTDQWFKPVVNAVVLPAHGQTSPPAACENLSAEAEFFSNDVNDTPESAGPFSCGDSSSIEVGDANYSEIIITGIAANVSPPGTTVSLDVAGDAVNAGNASPTSQTEDSDPTNGDVSFTDITFTDDAADGNGPGDSGGDASDGDTGTTADSDPTGNNLTLTFSAQGCGDCVIQISFTEALP